MSTRSHFKQEEIGQQNSHLFNKIRTTIETAYYRNNVTTVSSIAQAYELAKNSPGTIVTDLPVYNASELDLPNDATVLIFNDGIITGRQAKARKLINTSNITKYSEVLRDVIFNTRNKKCIMVLHM